MTRQHWILVIPAAIAVICAIMLVAYMRERDPVTIQGDGSAVGAEVWVDGARVGELLAARGESPRLPRNALLPTPVGEPVSDTTWLPPTIGYSECLIRVHPGMHQLTVISRDGRRLGREMNVDAGAGVSVSFALMAMQCISISS